VVGYLASGVVAVVGVFLATQWPFPALILLLAVGSIVVLRGTGRRLGLVPPAKLIPEVFLMPSVFGLSSINSQAALVGMILLVLWSLRRKRSPFHHVRDLLPLALLVAASLLVWTRPFTKHSFLALVVVALAVQVATWTEADRRAAIVSVIDGLGLYCLMDLAAYFAGVHSHALTGRLGLAETTGGPFAARVVFPLSPSGSVPAGIAAAYLAASLVLIMSDRQRRKLRLIGVVAAVLVLLGANFRAPFVLVAVLCIAVIVIPRGLRRIAPSFAVLALLAPLFLPVVGQTLNGTLNVVTAVVPYLSRHADTTVLSARDIVWSTSIEYWKGVPGDRQVIGYGALGQETSGATNVYGGVFSGGFANPESASPHNTTLQELFDAGLLGVLPFLGGVWITVRRYAIKADPVMLAGMLAALTIAATAATEVTLAPGTSDVALWLMLILAAASRPHRTRADPRHQAQGSLDPSGAVDDRERPPVRGPARSHASRNPRVRTPQVNGG
jgi:hypothetical protein